MLKLQAAIKYGEEDLVGAKSLVDQSPADDPDSDINRGCLLYKEARYEEALVKFNGAQQIVGYVNDENCRRKVMLYGIRYRAEHVFYVSHSMVACISRRAGAVPLSIEQYANILCFGYWTVFLFISNNTSIDATDTIPTSPTTSRSATIA